MQRDGEYVTSVRSAHERTPAQHRRRTRWQRLTDGARSRKDGGGAIALVDIAIHRHRSSNLVVSLHAPDCDRHIVDHAKPFTVIGEGMVEASADVDGDSIFQGVLRSEN